MTGVGSRRSASRGKSRQGRGRSRPLDSGFSGHRQHSLTDCSLLSFLPDPPSPDSPTETFAAPAEVRHFTDGSFPPGFVLQLFSHTQLRASDSKDSPREGVAAEGGLPQPESPSPGELLVGDDKGGLGRARLHPWGLASSRLLCSRAWDTGSYCSGPLRRRAEGGQTRMMGTGQQAEPPLC